MQNLLQVNIKKTYFKYLLAACGSAMITSIYGSVDAAVVGHYAGPIGSATLAVVMPIWNIIYSLGLLFGIGGSVAYSYYKGQNKAEKANAYFTLSLGLTIIVGVLCWLGVIFLDDQLLRLFGADETILPLAKEYILPIKFVIPVFPMTQMLSSFLRNDNEPELATKAVLIGGIFNVVGDLFFVFGLDMGMFGAGLATALGATLSVVIMLSHFFGKKNSIRLEKIHGTFHKSRIVSVNGFSTFISDLAMGIVSMQFNRQVMQLFDADALAVYGVIVQIAGLVQCTSYGAGQAAQPLLSTNFGAKEYGRVKETNKYGLLTAVIMGIIWTALFLLIPNVFTQLYMKPTESVLAIAPGIMRIYGLSFLLLPLNIYTTYYFPSVMQPKSAMVVSLGRGLVLCSILIYALPALFGKDAIWWVMPITEAVVVVYAIFSMRRMSKKKF